MDNLYLGGRMAAQNYEWLTEKVPNMKYILNVTSETSCYYEKEATFVYKRIPVSIPLLAFLSLTRGRWKMRRPKRYTNTSTKQPTLFTTRYKRVTLC